MLLFILFFLLLLGSAVGSFLNVVIYRLPAGLNLSYPASHCPKCGHPIRPRDNIPVFGWIFLKGKCRDCKAAISVRYPLVEGFCALLFVNVGYAVLANQPLDELQKSLGLIAYFLLLLTTLFAAAMIDYDEKKIPAKLFPPVILASLVVASLTLSPLLAGPPFPLVLLFLTLNRVLSRLRKFRIFLMFALFALTWIMILGISLSQKPLF